MSYDSWLERPYQLMAEEADKFIGWCEDEGLDPDDPKAVQAYEDWMQDMAEAWAEDAYDRYQDQLMDRYDSQYEYD